MGKNVWKKQMDKSHVLLPEVSEKLNIEETKLKQIIEGKRPMPIKLVDEFLIITNDKTGATISKLNIKHWFITTDLRGMRHEFGITIKELAEKIHLHKSTISKYELKPDNTSMDTMVRVYNYFHDELNKKIQDDAVHVSIIPTEVTHVIEHKDESQIEKLEKENIKLKLQITRYEKLIDRL